MRYYHIQLKVPADQLQTYIELLADSAAQIVVRPCQDEGKKERTQRESPGLIRYRGGRTLTEELITSIPAAGITRAGLEAHFRSLGANPVSVGPALSRAIKAGAVKKDGKKIILLDRDVKVPSK